MEVLGLVVVELLFSEELNILGPILPTEVCGERGLRCVGMGGLDCVGRGG